MEMYRALSILLLLHVVFINFTYGQHYYNRSTTEMLPILTKPDFFLIGAMKVAYITFITTILLSILIIIIMINSVVQHRYIN